MADSDESVEQTPSDDVRRAMAEVRAELNELRYENVRLREKVAFEEGRRTVENEGDRASRSGVSAEALQPLSVSARDHEFEREVISRRQARRRTRCRPMARWRSDRYSCRNGR